MRKPFSGLLCIGLLLAPLLFRVFPVKAETSTQYGDSVYENDGFQFPEKILGEPDDDLGRATFPATVALSFANFSFDGSVSFVEIGFKSCVSLADECHRIYVSDTEEDYNPEDDWVYCGYADQPVDSMLPYETVWHYFNQTAEEIPLSEVFNTQTKLNEALIKFYHKPKEGGGEPPPVLMWSSYVDSISLEVTITSAKPFVVWLGLFFFGGLIVFVVGVGIKKRF